MEDDRQKKLEAGREKLEAYKKKKQKKPHQSAGSTSASQSDTSISLSPPLLPENSTEVLSDSSLISEHLNSHSDSVENDHSYQEIEISNVPSDFSLMLQNLPADEDVEHISQEFRPPSLNTSVKSGSNTNSNTNNTSLSVVEKLGTENCDVTTNNVQGILDEILRSEQFKSELEETQRKKTSLESNGSSSFNMFDGVDLNDSLINDYGLKSVRTEDAVDPSASMNVVNFNVSLCNADKGDGSLKVKQLEELLSTKDTAIAALAAELESLRELTSSNQSTLSLNTTTTDYKLYHDEFQNKIVEFQNALSHRDTVIQQLTEALQQSVINREQLQEQSEYFSREIVALQNQLAETSAILSQRKWNVPEPETKHDSLKSIKDSSIQTDSLPSQVDGGQNLQACKNLTDDLNKSVNEADNMDELQPVIQNKEMEGAQEPNGDKSVLNLEIQCSKLEETLNLSQISLMTELKNCINSYVQYKSLECKNAHRNELKILEDKLENEKMNHESETERLRQLLASIQCDSVDILTVRQELEAKHAQELEELRTYFEQKCADLEKHYSEDVFSQQSRKMSGSSSCSETSDFLFSGAHPCPGPGGDSVQIRVDISRVDPKKRDLGGLSKNDLVKLKTDLSSIAKELENYKVESISKQELAALGLELKKYDLRCLLKYDLSVLKTEMQNKYHAELEILREDYENRIDALNVEHESRMQSVERKYVDKMESLKFDLDEALRNVDANVNTAVQEVASSGEYELAEVVQSYERRLQEQVTLAKIDIINALEHQIQMLVANTAEDAEWPTELLQLRNRFTEQYERQITQLELQHQEEIGHLKEEHRKILTGALDRARRRSLKDDSLSQSDMDVIKERDNLKKTTSILRQLIGELMKYFAECEEELNNTLVEELLKHGFEKSLTELEVELNLNESSNSTCSDSLTNKKRVHLTPKFEEIMATIDSSVPSSLDSNISLDLKNELGACLKRLRADANAILAVSTGLNKNNNGKNFEGEIEVEKLVESVPNSLQERIASLTKQLVVEGQIKKDLVAELDEARNFVQGLEAERSHLDVQVEQLVAQQKILESDLGKAHGKIAELIESGHKEIISEGFGENPKIGLSSSLGDRIATLSELQDRARSMVAECATSPDHPLLQLVEELCREGDRITEEAKNDHEDLQQQIEAADKKLRATCHFLEEQAAEREQERDESQREIASLHEQLREREKDRVNCERINKEEEEVESLNVCCQNFKNTIVHTVEHLEQQMRDMSKLIEANEAKHNEVECEKREAIEKIFVLRDIIRDLESQVEARVDAETELRTVVAQLEEIIKQQSKTNEELNQHLSSTRGVTEARRFQEHIEQLEGEVQRLRLNTELAGSEGALKQIKTQLNEFEMSIDKRTRDLEALHSAISATSCSSPSEDMSLRDQIRPKSPSALEECDVPLQQLARLKEKLVKHSRAEDAAVKRIRDLEMELVGIRHDLDEVQNERDILQDQVSEQLVLISSLQMRLDDQRLRADHVQKQTNTSLEMRIYDLENEIKTLVDTITTRDKTIKQLTKTVDETKKRLADQEREIAAKQDDKLIAELQHEIQKARVENTSLLAKINTDAQNAQVLPSLVDNILADKNKDLEMLRERLDKTQTELNSFLALNFDHEQLKALSRLQGSDRAFADLLSTVSLEAPDRMRAEKVGESLNNSFNPQTPDYKRSANETTFIGSGPTYQPELSRIEHVVRPNINYSVEAPLAKPNSTEIHKSAEKHVRFDDGVFNVTIEKLQGEILELKNELFARDETIKEYRERLGILTDLEANLEGLQRKLDFTENALRKTTQSFEKDQDALREIEKNLRIDLAEKKMHLIDKERQLGLSEEDSARKDQMYINLAKEKRELEKNLSQLQEASERYKEFDTILAGKNQEIDSLQNKLTQVGDSVEIIQNLQSDHQTTQEQLKTLQEDLSTKTATLNELQQILSTANSELQEKDNQNRKQLKDLQNQELQISNLTQQLETLEQTIKDKHQKLQELRNLLQDRETEIEILNEDANRYHDDIAKLEKALKVAKNSLETECNRRLALNERELTTKDLEIAALTTNLDGCKHDINHLQDLLEQKEKIIDQMSQDSRSLHVNLEAIQDKMQEAGNVVDLKRRLEEEQSLTTRLQKELNVLKTAESNKPVDMTASIEEITGAVRQQLEYSAHLDTSILNALGAGDGDHITSLSLTDSNDLHVLKQTLSKERLLNLELNKLKDVLQGKLHELEQRYAKEKENSNQLKNLLQNEKQNCNTIQVEDANLLEHLRTRLEAALEQEGEFQKLLEAEKRARHDLELLVANLKQKAALMSSGENSKTELTEYKSLPSLQALDLMMLKKDVQGLQEENGKLKTEIKNLKRAKGEAEAGLKYSNDMLQLKNEDVKKLEVQIGGMKEVEASIKDKWMEAKAELQQRNREIENSRALMGEIEQEGRDMKVEINRLNEDLKRAIDSEQKLLAENTNEVQMKQSVPDTFLNKMKELSILVKEHMKDNQRMSVTVDKLTDERRILQERINELEEVNNVKLPFDDPIGRANHLFAKYLRAESYRKALIWQKRYLVALLATYQAYPVLPQDLPLPAQQVVGMSRPVRSIGKQRFKAVAVAITVVIRMQFLVQRWHSGKRGVRSQLHQRPPRSAVHLVRTSNPAPPSSAAQFHVGQPVSSQNFPVQSVPSNSNRLHSVDVANPVPNFPQRGGRTASSTAGTDDRRSTTPTSPIDLGPWSGITPPSREQRGKGSGRFSVATSSPEGYIPLQAPGLLSQYVERFDLIQHRLGMAVDKNST